MRRAEHGGIISKLIALLFLALLICGIYLLRHPILRMAGNFWVVDDPLQKSDAIVVIGDDDYSGDRAARAAALFKQGWAPTIVASGRELRPYASISELETHDLQGDGVAKQSIVQFSQRAENTREEALALRDLFAQRGWHKIVIVTSNYHTRRARFIFSRVMPTNVDTRVVSAPDANYDPDGWWETREGIKLFSLECAGYLVARWELRGNSFR